MHLDIAAAFVRLMVVPYVGRWFDALASFGAEADIVTARKIGVWLAPSFLRQLDNRRPVRVWGERCCAGSYGYARFTRHSFLPLPSGWMGRAAPAPTGSAL